MNKSVHPRLAKEVETWDDMELLCHAGVAIKRKLTRAAILLLGKETSTHLISPAVATITWVLVDEQKSRKIGNLLSTLKKNGVIRLTEGKRLNLVEL